MPLPCQNRNRNLATMINGILQYNLLYFAQFSCRLAWLTGWLAEKLAGWLFILTETAVRERRTGSRTRRTHARKVYVLFSMDYSELQETSNGFRMATHRQYTDNQQIVHRPSCISAFRHRREIAKSKLSWVIFLSVVRSNNRRAGKRIKCVKDDVLFSDSQAKALFCKRTFVIKTLHRFYLFFFFIGSSLKS